MYRNIFDTTISISPNIYKYKNLPSISYNSYVYIGLLTKPILMVRNSKRRDVLQYIGAAAIGTSLAGCTGDGGDGDGDGGDGGNSDGGNGGNSGGGDGGNGDGDGGDGGSEDVTLRWSTPTHGGPRSDVEDAIAESFGQENELDVEMVRWPPAEYLTQIQNVMGTRNAPDVADNGAGPGELGLLVDADRYVPLEDYVGQEALGTVIQSVLDWGRFGDGELINWMQGTLYGVPLELAGIMVFYNKNVLTDSGIDPESIKHRSDITWDEFMDLCGQVQEAGNQPIYLGNRNQWPGAHWLAAFLNNAAGGQAFLDATYGRGDSKWTDDHYVEALSRLQSLYQEEYMNADVNSLNNAEAASLFLNDQAAFYHQGSWMPSIMAGSAPEGYEIGDQIDFMWWPYFPDLYENAVNERLTFAGRALAISKESEERGQAEAAGKLIEYIMAEDNLKEYLLKADMTITNLDIWEEYEDELSLSSQTLKTSMDHLGEADMLTPLFDVAFLPEPREYLLSAGQEILADSLDPATAMEELQEKTDEAVQSRQ